MGHASVTHFLPALMWSEVNSDGCPQQITCDHLIEFEKTPQKTPSFNS